MNVLIVTEGGKGIGLGHVTRCIALHDAFGEMGARPRLVVNCDRSTISLLRRKRHRILDWLDDEPELLDMVSGSDIVIIDSYMSGSGLFKKIAATARLAAYLDDNRKMEYPKGVVINGAVNARDLKYPKKKGVTYLTGAKFALLRKEFWQAPHKRLRKEIRAVMVTFGGDDSKKMTLRILKLLVERYPKLMKKVIIGNNFSDRKSLEAAKDRNTEFIVEPDAKRMKSVMLGSDIAISAGGQTLFELARLGQPVIAVMAADNQMNNLKGMNSAGAIEYAGRWDDAGMPTRVERCVEKLKDVTARALISRRSASLVDGKGSIRVARFLLKEVSD